MDAKTTAAAEKVMRARPPLTLALQAHLTLEQKKNVRKKTVELLERQRKEPNR